MMNEFIITENLCYTYEEEDGIGVDVLKNVSLKINKGEYVAILGHNGSGKSTFAKLLNLILIPTSGKIFIDGVDIASDNISEDDVLL